MPIKSIIKSISFVTLGLILGKITAFLKHAIIVKYSGVTYDADVFFIANTIPETGVNIILAGILTGAFIPIASEVLAKHGNSRFGKLVYNSFYIFGSILSILALFLYLFSSKVSILIAPGYHMPQHLIITNILKIFSPGIFFIGLAAILTGAMQTREEFFIPSLGLFIANATTILFIIFLFDKIGIYAAAVGTSAGFFLWFLSHVPYTFKYLLPNRGLYLRDEFLKKVATLAFPTTLIVLINNLILIIEKSVASRFVEGTVTHLNLAFRLTLIFSNLLILPFATVLLPKMSKEYGKSNRDKLYQMTNRAFISVTILLFLVLIIVLFNTRLITLVIYKPIGISYPSIIQIADFLRIYALAFLGLFYYLIILRLFFSTQHIKELLTANFLGLLVYIFIVFTLSPILNSNVLPLAYGVFYITTSTYLFLIMRRNIFPGKAPILDKSVFLTGLIISVSVVIIIFWTRNKDLQLYQEFIISIFFILFFLFRIRKKLLSNLRYLITKE